MLSVQRLLNYRWKVPHQAFTVTTDDGVHIVGTALVADDTSRPALVLAHGLMGWHRRKRFAIFAEELTRWFAVYAMDLRGHGASGGVGDYGGAEISDVDAVVALAHGRGHATVVTMGMSMGAISVIRHAALRGGVDAVVAISSLAWWNWRDTAHPKVAGWMDRRIVAKRGRRLLRVWGTRLPDEWTEPPSPEEVIAKIAPTPVLLVHGDHDGLFSLPHAELLFELAGEPKRMLIGRGGRHAEDLIQPGFAELLARHISELLAARA
jgi:pimeloyl-ACP methyl ester carboxylesterase